MRAFLAADPEVARRAAFRYGAPDVSSSSAQRTGIPHLPALDGLRGTALLGVLFFHANGALPGGYLGVDLFFVLSGFLITSLLLKEHEDTGRIALSTFWVRRARRLFPALLSLMPAVALYGAFFAKPTELRGLRADALATLGYVANWRAIFTQRSYWELFAAPSPLEHTWSLSIEEQFYVVWPLVIWLVLRRGTRRSVLFLSLALMAASVAAMLLLFNPESTSRVYLGTDTRATGILAGAVLATFLSPSTVISQSTARKLDVLGLLAIVGLGAAWWKLRGSDRFLYHGGFWLTELGALVLIACAVANDKSIIARILSLKPLTLVGTISYGVYLWHWPVNVLLTQERVHAGRYLHVVQFAVTFAIAIVSYRFLERPIRQRGIPFGRPAYVVPAVVAVAILMVVRGTHARPLLASTNSPEPIIAPPPVFADAPELKIMVLGDSTANSLGWCLRGLRKPGVSVELEGQDGCKILTDSCKGPEWAKKTQALRPQATLVFVGGAYLYGITVDGKWKRACEPEWQTAFENNLDLRLGDLAAPGTRVWAVTVPYPLGPYENDDYRNQVDCINRSLRKAVSRAKGVDIIDLQERLCPKGECEREYNGVVIRADGVHYSIDGGAGMAAWLMEQLLK